MSRSNNDDGCFGRELRQSRRRRQLPPVRTVVQLLRTRFSWHVSTASCTALIPLLSSYGVPAPKSEVNGSSGRREPGTVGWVKKDWKGPSGGSVRPVAASESSAQSVGRTFIITWCFPPSTLRLSFPIIVITNKNQQLQALIQETGLSQPRRTSSQSPATEHITRTRPSCLALCKSKLLLIVPLHHLWRLPHHPTPSCSAPRFPDECNSRTRDAYILSFRWC